MHVYTNVHKYVRLFVCVCVCLRVELFERNHIFRGGISINVAGEHLRSAYKITMETMRVISNEAVKFVSPVSGGYYRSIDSLNNLEEF